MVQGEQKVLYEWQAPEFVTGEGRGWNVWVWVILLVVAGWSVWIRMWTTLIVVVAVAAVLYLLRLVQPRVFTHQLTEEGVLVGQRLYAYDQLRSFWIVLDGAARTLNLLPKRKWGPLLTLQLGDANVDKVRETLTKFLPEDANRGEDTVDKIGRFFRL